MEMGCFKSSHRGSDRTVKKGTEILEGHRTSREIMYREIWWEGKNERKANLWGYMAKKPKGGIRQRAKR